MVCKQSRTYIRNIERQDEDDHEGKVPRDEDGQRDQCMLLAPVAIAMEQNSRQTTDTGDFYS